MSKTTRTEKHPEEQLWHELKHAKAGMLGLEDSHSHMQPMAQMCDPENGRLWFFTSKSGDLVSELGNGSRAHFCVVGHHQDFHACLSGELRQIEDAGRKQELWNSMTGAWFSGPDDPDLALLEFVLDDAAIWASTRNPVKFVWEINRAKNSDREPDVGARAHVDFNEPKGTDAREQSGKRI
jgi:general stress protein 26